jgi:hypothetical protein
LSLIYLYIYIYLSLVLLIFFPALKMSLSNQNLGTSGKSSSSILIEISDPQNHLIGSKKYTDYLVKTQVDLIRI